MLATWLTLVATYSCTSHRADKHAWLVFVLAVATPCCPRATLEAHLPQRTNDTRAHNDVPGSYTLRTHMPSCRVHSCARQDIRTHAVSKRTVKNQKSNGENVKASASSSSREPSSQAYLDPCRLDDLLSSVTLPSGLLGSCKQPTGGEPSGCRLRRHLCNYLGSG
jgi:hypothetical protein